MMKYILELKFDYFRNDVFSKNDAFRWMVSNSINGKIAHSLRQLATIWQWHYSSVKRFLDFLHSEKIIITDISNKTTIITILDYEQYLIVKQNCNNTCNTTDQEKQKLPSNIETTSEAIPQQIVVKNKDCNNTCNSTSQGISAIIGSFETVSETMFIESDFQEKKKRTKKRKEINTKEKYIPYRDIQKEKKFSENAPPKFCDYRVLTKLASPTNFQAENPIFQINLEDIDVWAKETLPFELDLGWELGKFEDYWNSIPKKPPKNGSAAFRNWLRKAVEIKIQNGDNNDRFNNKNPKQRQQGTDFERFLTGGVRALAELGGD